MEKKKIKKHIKLIAKKMDTSIKKCAEAAEGNINVSIKNVLIILICAIIVFDQVLIINIKTKLGIAGYMSKMANNIIYRDINKAVVERNIKLTGNIQEDAIEIIMIKGEPDLYGKKLNVSFDRIQESIDIMKKYDPNINIFSEKEFGRYSNITGKISCEFCCTVTALTYADGKPTCNCDHARAMRGLAAYLIKNYGNKFSNDDILREIARWKGLFFPKQMIGKLINEIKSGKLSPDIDAILNGIQLPKYDLTDQNMNNDEMENVPDMVGGC